MQIAKIITFVLLFQKGVARTTAPNIMEFTEFLHVFRTVMGDNGFSRFSGEEFAAKFHQLCEHMLEVNQYMNLTAIKEPRAVILRHFADSLTIEPLLPQGACVVDVGCGAGFPSLPLAICRPDLKILSLDSTAKRIRYVEQTAHLLGCSNLTAITARAEEAAKTAHREKYDICTARAVAALPVLSELCLPFVKQGGRFLAMKARQGDEEWSCAEQAVSRLGGALLQKHRVLLRDEGAETEERIIFEIKKCRSTPREFPRRYAQILKIPL